MRFLFTMTALSLMAISLNGYAANLCNKADKTAIDKAIAVYLSKASTFKPQDVVITAEHCAKEYASAKVTPKHPVADTATVYLHKVKNEWQVLSLGTDFDADFLKTIPQELQ